MKTAKEILEEVHEIIANWYDEELERNEINAKKNYSRVTLILKERIEGINLE